MSLLTLLIVLLVASVVWGGYSHTREGGPYPLRSWSPLGIVLVVLLLLWLFGGFGHGHGHGLRLR